MSVDPLPVWSWSLSGFVLGAIIGSFLATLILRWPQGRSVLAGRSACDGCGRVLGVVDLVPLLSALAQGGRCKSCAAPIDWLHFRVELTCGLAGAAALGLAPGIEGLGWAVLVWFLITLAILDHRHFWLPDALTWPLAFLGFTLAMWVTPVALPDRVVGAASGYGSLMLIAVIYQWLRGRTGMGGGDAKLLGAIGAWFGWQPLPLVLLIASLTALTAAGLRAARGGEVSSSTQMPLGTYMAIATLPAWLAARMLGMA
ncbi:prepilin peptidase [Rhizorhapis suberifaciens]|uniref:Prepilin leader peptidase/N-methyltransferase n=1 Tax=Rhizorhapis suberifaciens TaxID=13656 RepID=A0A840HTV7_9SPHN|nr:A24 family peptidase [Rhizorhapis suberifaciens]MBB4641039.1 leader peptidase (prepilin peptidase)/N-methyltransferase [Rhizorhapis suberifaciens]